IAITLAGGRTLNLSYIENRIILTGPSTPSNPTGLLATYTRTGNDLAKVEYPGGMAMTFDYDDSGQLELVTDATNTIVEKHSYLNGRAQDSSVGIGQERYVVDEYLADRP